jgi:ABC-type uncharacterized transport system substrate-binding protein
MTIVLGSSNGENKTCRILAVKLHGRLRKCEDNIKVDLKEIGFEDVTWTEVAQNYVHVQ